MPTTEFTYSDEDRQVDYELLITYTAYPGERAVMYTKNGDGYPGSPPTVEWTWELQEVIDWSFDPKQGVSVTFSHETLDAMKYVRRWLASRIESGPVKEAIDERCFTDANEREESALAEYEDAKFEEMRLRRRGE